MIKVYNSTINGIIEPPPSKSYTHRAVAIASLADGRSIISNPLIGRDTLATINGCRLLGSEITLDKDLRIYGRRYFDKGDRNIDAQNSGTTIRFLIAMSALVREGKTILVGDKSLMKRPMQPLVNALSQLGVKCYTTDGKPPVIVYGGGIKGGKADIQGDVSSQFISALLFSSIYAENDVMLNITSEQVSRPYIDATILVMNRFNVDVENQEYRYYHIKRQEYKPTDFRVPEDFSSIAMLLAAGALLGSIEVKADLSIPQPDARIIDILKNMDADIKVYDNRIKVNRRDRLSDIDVNLSDTPDLLPVVSILALNARDVTIRGVKHARVKESDRIAIIANELKKLGVYIKEFEDGLEIKSSGSIKNARLDAHDDHRLFMAFFIAGMLAKECIIDGEESVDVSYPNFITDMKKIGARVEIV